MPKTRKSNKYRKSQGRAYMRVGRPAINENLKDMCKIVSEIKLLRKIKNAMLSTGAYGDIEREEQIRKASQRGDLTDKELSMVNDIFDIQKNLSGELQILWGTYIGDKNDTDKKGDIKIDKFKEYRKKQIKECTES